MPRSTFPSSIRASPATPAGLAITAGDLADPWIAAIDELVATMDRAIPAPARDLAAPFLMPVETVHTIDGIGAVVTGRIARGTLTVGQTLDIVGRRDGEVRAVS